MDFNADFYVGFNADFGVDFKKDFSADFDVDFSTDFIRISGENYRILRIILFATS